MWFHFWTSFTWFFLSWHMMVQTFSGATPPHSCGPSDGFWNYSSKIVENNATLQSQTCSLDINHTTIQTSISCGDNNTKLSYDSEFGSTIVSEWNLTCSTEGQALADTAGSMYMFGIAVGSLVTSPLADRYGRRWVLLATLWISIPINIGTAFVQSYEAYVALRFITAVCYAGTTLASWSLCCEIITADLRSYASIFCSLFWVIGFVLLGIIADFERNWRYLQLIISIPTTIFLIYFWFSRESIHWLACKGKTEQAHKEIEFAAKINGKIIDPFDYYEEDKENKDKSIQKNSMLKDLQQLICSPMLFVYTVVMCYNWFVDSTVYYGLSLVSTEYSSNRYLSFCLSGAVEGPAYLIMPILMRRMGRRSTNCLFHALAGVSLIILTFLPQKTSSGVDLEPLVLTLSLIGKFSISAAFMGLYLYAAEIFPTTLRTLGVGLSNCFARIGGVLAPYVGLLSAINKDYPPLIFGALAISIAMLTFILPETRDNDLPETPNCVAKSEFIKIVEKIFRRKQKVHNSDDSEVKYGATKQQF